MGKHHNSITTPQRSKVWLVIEAHCRKTEVIDGVQCCEYDRGWSDVVIFDMFKAEMPGLTRNMVTTMRLDNIGRFKNRLPEPSIKVTDLNEAVLFDQARLVEQKKLIDDLTGVVKLQGRTIAKQKYLIEALQIALRSQTTRITRHEHRLDAIENWLLTNFKGEFAPPPIYTHALVEKKPVPPLDERMFEEWGDD